MVMVAKSSYEVRIHWLASESNGLGDSLVFTEIKLRRNTYNMEKRTIFLTFRLNFWEMIWATFYSNFPLSHTRMINASQCGIWKINSLSELE